jgi:hypothetical protein
MLVRLPAQSSFQSDMTHTSDVGCCTDWLEDHFEMPFV